MEKKIFSSHKTFIDLKERMWEKNYVLVSYKNGSLLRERVRDEVAGGSWDSFNSLLGETPRGNFGNLGMRFDFTL
jgi:hypothetical protein